MANPKPTQFYTVDDHTLSQAKDILEVLANLNYLACEEAHNPGAVRRWTTEAEAQIKRLGRLLGSISADATPAN